jgi:hypothetical protein
MALFERVMFDPTDPQTGTIFYVTDRFGHQAELTRHEAIDLLEWLTASLAANEEKTTKRIHPPLLPETR